MRGHQDALLSAVDKLGVRVLFRADSTAELSWDGQEKVLFLVVDEAERWIKGKERFYFY